MSKLLEKVGMARVKVYYDIGKSIKGHADINFAKNELKLTDGQIGLARMLSKYDWEIYKDCISLSQCKQRYDIEQDKLRVTKPTKATKAQVEATQKKNKNTNYDFIDL